MSQVSVKPNEEATFTCEIFGYPTSTVTWSYIPCEKSTFDPQSCDSDKQITFTVIQ